MTDNQNTKNDTLPDAGHQTSEERDIDKIADMLKGMIQENQPFINMAIALEAHYTARFNAAIGDNQPNLNGSSIITQLNKQKDQARQRWQEGAK